MIFLFHLSTLNMNNEIQYTSSHDLRIAQLEGITGLLDLNYTEEETWNNTEIETLMIFLNKKYNLYQTGVDVYDTIVNTIRFSIRALTAIGANNPNFYDNMTLDEACLIILTKLIGNSGTNIESSDGFPEILNFTYGQQNNIRVFNEKKWFPYVRTGHLSNYNQLLTKVLYKLGATDTNLLFHGTSWESALSIMMQERVTQRERASDFGMKNFYTTDSFVTACQWADRNNQKAVVIFIPPEDFIDSLENKIVFSCNEMDAWKEFVFFARNPPRLYDPKRLIYNQRMEEIDAHDLIIGPICKNPIERIASRLEAVTYGRHTPYQFSFKESSIERLNECYAITIFFQNI